MHAKGALRPVPAGSYGVRRVQSVFVQPELAPFVLHGPAVEVLRGEEDGPTGIDAVRRLVLGGEPDIAYAQAIMTMGMGTRRATGAAVPVPVLTFPRTPALRTVCRRSFNIHASKGHYSGCDY